MTIVNSKKSKLLLPLVAFVIIMANVVIVLGSGKKARTKDMVQESIVTQTPVGSVSAEKKIEKYVNFSLVGETSMKVGKTYKVELKARSSKDLELSSLETYVSFPETGLKLSSLKVNPALGNPVFSKISTKQNVVVTNMLFAKPYVVVKDVDFLVKSFDVTPTAVGQHVLTLKAGDGETLIVSSKDAKQVGYMSNVLNISVEK